MNPNRSTERRPDQQQVGIGLVALITFLLILIFMLASCTSPASGGSGGSVGGIGSYDARDQTVRYGVVESIELVDRDRAGVSVGMLAGAVVGGLLGSQVGSGRGQTAATIAGAAGGAYAGKQIEEQRRGADQVFRIRVRLNDGSVVTVAQEASLNLRPGDRVRVQGGTAQPY